MITIAYRIMQHPSGVQRKVKVGFSWTTMFWDYLPSIFRGDWISALKLFFLGPPTFGIYNILKWFTINEDYYESLLMKGFVDISEDPWYRTTKEKSLIRMKKSLSTANIDIYKKLNLSSVKEKFNLPNILNLEIISIMQMILIGIEFLVFVYKIFSYFPNYYNGSFIDACIAVVFHEIILIICILIPIFIIGTFILLGFVDESSLGLEKSFNNYNKENVINNSLKTISEEDKLKILTLEEKLKEAKANNDIERIIIIKEMIEEIKNGD